MIKLCVSFTCRIWKLLIVESCSDQSAHGGVTQWWRCEGEEGCGRFSKQPLSHSHGMSNTFNSYNRPSVKDHCLLGNISGSYGYLKLLNEHQSQSRHSHSMSNTFNSYSRPSVKDYLSICDHNQGNISWSIWVVPIGYSYSYHTTDCDVFYIYGKFPWLTNDHFACRSKSVLHWDPLVESNR